MNMTNSDDPANIPVPSDDEGLHCIGLESIDTESALFIEDDMKNLAWRIEININDDDINSLETRDRSS